MLGSGGRSFLSFVRGDWERKDKFERMAGYVLATFDQMQSDGRISSDWVLVSGSDWMTTSPQTSGSTDHTLK